MTSLLPDNLLDELNDLTFACLSGEASPEAIEHLNKLLLNSEPARRVYAHTIRDSFILRQWAAATELHTREMLGDDDSDAAFLRLAIADADLIATASSSISREDDPPTAAPVAAVPIPGFFSTAYHGTIGFFSQELPFALLIATVLTSLGLWAASMVYVSSPEKIAKDSPALPSKATVDPTLDVVGKITGMVDCKWADPQTETVNGANVLFGRKYALASGLMEITYDTGAKVILQGPVTYKVDSRDGGYLSIGKLTARLEKKQSANSGQQLEPAAGMANHKSEIINQKSLASSPQPLAPNSNPQSLIPNPFVIHTPSAVVTDLGTEFGVEVSKDGTTDTHVFEGTVKMSSCGKNRGRCPESTLSVGQSMQVDRSGTINRKNAAHLAMGFVRQLPNRNMATEYSKAVLADKPVFYWNFDEPGETISEQVRHLENQRLYPIGGARRCAHNIIGSGLSLGRTADFSKAAGAFRSGLLEQGVMPGAWAIEFWAQFTGNLTDPTPRGIMEAGAESRYGRCNPAILFNDRRNGIENTFVAASVGYQTGMNDRCTYGGPRITDHLWHHVILVFYGNGGFFGVADRVDIIVDAVPQTIERRGFTSGFDMEGLLRVGAARDDLEDSFQGRIDELAFYDLSKLTVKQIETRVADMAKHHFQAARPTDFQATILQHSVEGR